jgi:hypothetical protein
MHHITLKDGHLMLYGDPKLQAYLLSLQQGVCPATVVPVYSGEPAAFLHHGMVVVSTGLILEAESEESLRATLAAVRPAWYVRLSRGRECVRPPVHTACSLAPEGAFEEHRARLERDTRRYAEMTRPQLRVRYALAGQPGK